MASILITLHTAAYLDEADPDYELGLRAAYKMAVELDDADQAAVDATQGAALELAGINAASWSRVPGIGAATQVLASPPTGLTLSIGAVTPDNVSTGLRRISFQSTPPGADHATTWVGFATIGVVWTGMTVVEEEDLPDDYDLPGTGLATSIFTNLSCSGVPANQYIGLIRTTGVNVTDPQLLGPAWPTLTQDVSVSARGSFKIPATATYRLTLNSDDGCRFYADGAPLIDDWTNHRAIRVSGEVQWEADQIVNVRIENFSPNNPGNGHVLIMLWSINGAAPVEIPITVMYPIGWDEAVPVAPRPVQTAFGAEAVTRYFQP
jgi:hypothetical protein